ncbi:MAG: Crp/Fnr family transcriptional regulator [Bacteroidota bacterium]
MTSEQVQEYLEAYLDNLRALKMQEENIDLLKSNLKIARVKSKDTLINPGEICRNVYLVIEGGFVCRYIHEKNGEAKTINFYLPDLHPVMACLDSYFAQVPTECELKAIGDSIAVGLPKSVIDVLIAKDPGYAKYYHEVVSTAMTEENEVKTKLIAYSSKEKYEFVVREMPSVIQKVPSKYIAEFCGISPEWLSKLKKKQ